MQIPAGLGARAHRIAGFCSSRWLRKRLPIPDYCDRPFDGVCPCIFGLLQHVLADLLGASVYLQKQYDGIR